MNQESLISSLKDERDRFLAFAFCRADLLIELSDNHDIVFISGATQSIFGSSIEELMGTSLSELVLPQEQPVLDNLLAGMVGGTRPEPIEIIFKKKDGAPRPLSITGYYVQDLKNHYFLSCKTPSSIHNRVLCSRFKKPLFSLVQNPLLHQGQKLLP